MLWRPAAPAVILGAEVIPVQAKLVTAKTVAAICDVSEARVYEMARLGLIPCVRLGRQVRFDLDQIQAWIDEGGRPLAEAEPGPPYAP